MYTLEDLKGKKPKLVVHIESPELGYAKNKEMYGKPEYKVIESKEIEHLVNPEYQIFN